MSESIENPIEAGAKGIKAIVTPLAQTEFKGVFPRNFSYGIGNYNCLFIIARGEGDQSHGFFRRGEVVTLGPGGDFTSGMVNQKVENYHSGWEFHQAHLKPATDLQVVKFAPTLVTKLYDQTNKEILGQYTEDERASSAEKIKQALDILPKKGETLGQLIAISRRALVEMGVEDPDALPAGDLDFGGHFDREIPSIIAGLKGYQPKEANRLEHQRQAFYLFALRKEMEEGMRKLARGMRVSEIEDKFRDIVEQTVKSRIFPELMKDPDGTPWFACQGMNFRAIQIPSHHQPEYAWNWGISADGQVREVKNWSSHFVTQPCAEHLLEQAPDILGAFISQIARNHFPRLKVLIYNPYE